MYILKIKLNDKTYGLDKIKASALKKILSFQKRNAIMQAQAKATGEDISEEIIDMMAEFLVSVYDKQFTVEELWDGLELSELQPAFNETVNTIMSAFGAEDNKKK